MAAQGQDGTLDQAGLQQSVGHCFTGVQSRIDSVGGKCADIEVDQAVTEVAVGVDDIGRAASDGRTAGQVNGVADDRGSGVGPDGAAGQDGDGGGDA